MTHVITKLGLLDGGRPGQAFWSEEDCYSLWERLHEEYELESRFRNLDFKLGHIGDNLKFFTEVLEGKKSTRLEWAIIVLIAAELALGLYDHIPF